MKPRIVFVGWDDWGNLANGHARALRAFGFDARCIQMRSHPFEFRQDITLIDGLGNADAVTLLKNADVIICTDSRYDLADRMLFDMGLSPLHADYYPYARLFTMHVGTAFREDVEKYDMMDAERGFELRIMARDLMRFTVARDLIRFTAHGIPAVAFTQCVAPGRYPLPGDRPVITHSAGNPVLRRSDEIVRRVRAMPEVAVGGIEFRLVPSGRPHSRALAIRRLGLDAASETPETIYIDHLNHDYGGFGGASCEAQAWGAVVIGAFSHAQPGGGFEVHPGLSLEDCIRHRLAVDGYDERREAWAWAYDHCRPEAIVEDWKRWLSL